MNDRPEQKASASAPASSVAPNSSTPSTARVISGSDLQQALIQSMMSSQGRGPSNSFLSQGQSHGQGLSLSQMDIVQQLIGMGENNNMATGGVATAAPFSHPMLQPQSQNNSGNNNNIVSQLVASLQAQQAQQQSQQQAQVQAAISRAFGPSSVGGGQQQLQHSNNGQNLFSQMQLAQAQGLISGNNNSLFSSFGGVGNDLNGSSDFQNRMFQFSQFDGQNLIKRAAMMAGQDAAMKKQKTDTSSIEMNNGSNMNKFGKGTLFSSVQGLPNSIFSNSIGIPGIVNPNAAAAFRNNSEVDLHQKLAGARGAVIVPCRARGMPVDHNFKTAYFIIPDGIEHGDELVCSFPACRQAGVKFRYCVDCKVPVAKRNFRNRHRHGVPGGDGGSVSGEDDDDEDNSGGEDDNKQDGTAYSTEGNMCMPTAEGNQSVPQNEHIIVIPDKPKKTKSARVPCRARGMPIAHNFKTAHFIIPPNIRHGDELVCSFPPCRSAGAKFRYCLHCKVPVAKRNFRNRHRHGNVGEKKKASSSQEKKDDFNMEEKEDKLVDAYPAGKRDSMEGTEDDPEENEGTEEDTEEDEGDLKPSASPSVATDKSVSTSTTNNNTVAINSTHDPDRVQQWVSLLDSKPDPSDKQAMAIWMMNLMHATDAMSSRSPVTAGSVSKNSEPKTNSPDEKPSALKKEETTDKNADV